MRRRYWSTQATTSIPLNTNDLAASTILDVCLKEDRVLVTLDLDFADIRLYPPPSHSGIWVLRPGTQSIQNALFALRGALALLGKEPAANRLWMVEASRIRIRE
jgi:predicted nuclease of predicted toxin-antitoxin system